MSLVQDIMRTLRGMQKVKINDKVKMSDVTMYQSKKDDTFNALSFTSSMENVDEQIASIISLLCNQSKDGYADREEIIKKGELQSISAVNIVGAIDKLKRNGRIFEPQLHRYCTTSGFNQRE